MQVELSHNSNKWEILFKVTQFDRILLRQLQNENNQFKKDLILAEGMIKSHLLAHVKKISSQHNLKKFLEEEPRWQSLSGFNEEIPHQSTFSRHWNDESYVEVLEQIYLNLIALIGHKNVHLEHELPVHLHQLLKGNFLHVEKPRSLAFLTFNAPH